MSDQDLRELQRVWHASMAWSDWLAWARLAARKGDPVGLRLVRSAERMVRLNTHLQRASSVLHPPLRLRARERRDLMTRVNAVQSRCSTRLEAERLRAIRCFAFLLAAGQNPVLDGAPWALAEFIRGFGVSLENRRRDRRHNRAELRASRDPQHRTMRPEAGPENGSDPCQCGHPRSGHRVRRLTLGSEYPPRHLSCVTCECARFVERTQEDVDVEAMLPVALETPTSPYSATACECGHEESRHESSLRFSRARSRHCTECPCARYRRRAPALDVAPPDSESDMDDGEWHPCRCDHPHSEHVHGSAETTRCHACGCEAYQVDPHCALCGTRLGERAWLTGDRYVETTSLRPWETSVYCSSMHHPDADT